MLLVFGGLPAVGKTTIATELAREIGAVYVWIDSIEQALRNSDIMISGPEDYFVAYEVASDNLKLGRTVIADSVNPVETTRVAWRETAHRAGTSCMEIEIVCSERKEHRRSAATRIADIPGHRPPSWEEIRTRNYEPWKASVVIDIAGKRVEQCVAKLKKKLGSL